VGGISYVLSLGDHDGDPTSTKKRGERERERERLFNVGHPSVLTQFTAHVSVGDSMTAEMR
jgi:hypothetical protein